MCYAQNVTPLILAGGLGTRLRSVIAHKPKALASVNDRPFLSYLLDQLIAADFRKVILCTGHKAGMVREAFGQSYKELIICYSQESKPLGTGGALRYALPMIEKDTVLAMNGDSYIDADINAYLGWFFKKKIDAALLLVKVNDVSRYGRVEIDRNSHVIRFEEKKKSGGEGFINSGVYIFKKKMLECIPPAKKFSLERELFPNLINKGLCGYVVESKFIDIGTPESYAEVKRFFKKAVNVQK